MFHSVIQVIPREDFAVYVYFDDGRIKHYDVKPLLGSGVFKQISDRDSFISKCTVLNNTLAWDLSGRFDPYTCLDIDPEQIYYTAVDVDDPLRVSA